MIKVGIIGLGGMGGTHANAYKNLGDKVKVTAVADVSENKRNKYVEMFGAKAYDDGFSLIENADVDYVDICLPTFLHTKHAVKAMEKGLNVFMEKPVCLNEDEAKLLLETEKKTGARVQIGQVIRFWTEYVYLKSLVDSGKYGKIISGVFTRLSGNPRWGFENWYNDPEKSGTMGLDLHIHDVDFIRYIMGNPKEIQSNCTRDAEGVLQQIFTTYKYDDAVITAEGCWDFPDRYPFSSAYRVKFEKATVVYSGKTVVYLEDGTNFEPNFAEEINGDTAEGLNVTNLGGYFAELEYYADHLESGEPLKVAPLNEAIESVRMAWKEIELCGGKVRKN
ncbi:MAG: Gfo/Idh/MocA family oxidoreductase [Bacillota bacterium]|nr:Gfo/Idh/MocA family oxidoreductase [Bacillota bacterium]